jgi:lipid-A-disaccharide synthase
MREAGCHLHYELTNLAVVGIAEVLPKLKEFFRVADLAEAEFKRGDIRGVVLVDFPGFNWHIAKRAKKYGIPVFYYLPPQLWAWASWRISKMRRWVDHVLCNLPFEAEWYHKRGIEVHDVGHPFFDEVAERKLDQRFMSRYQSSNQQLVAVLPGSRGHEVTRNFPVQLEVMRRLHREFPHARFLVAGYKPQQTSWCRGQLTAADEKLPIDFCVGKTSEIIELADVAMMVSGSVSLEVMARNTPAVVQYRPTRFTCWLGKSLASCKYISLPNLIADKEIMKEFIHTGSVETAANDIHREVHKLLAQTVERARVQKELNELTQRYAQPGATARASSVILDILAKNGQKSIVTRAA